MSNYFKNDFKRAFFSRYNLIAMIIIFFISVIEIYYANSTHNELKNNGVYLMMAVLNSGRIALLPLLCPLIICMPYVISYLQDKEYGFINFVITRVEKKTYLKIRIIINAIVSFLVMFLPLIVIYLVLLLFKGVPSINLFHEGDATGLASSIAYKYQSIYPIFCILGYSIFGATYGTFALGLSTVINNKYLSLIIPTIIYRNNSYNALNRYAISTEF